MELGKPKDFEILLRISQSIISTLDHQEVLQIISDGMADLMGIETAAVYLLDGESFLYLSATTPPLPPEIPEEFRKAEINNHPHIKKVVESKKANIIPDTANATLSPSEEDIVKVRNLKSLVFVPFLSEEMVMGVLILGTCNSSKLYSEYDVNLVQTVANQFSIAIKNSLLHNDLKNHKDNLEQMVQDKTKDLDAAIEELRTINEELYDKNEIINKQNAELKLALKSLKETQAQLFQTEKMASLGILTAGVAHEINNPLNFLMGSFIGLENYFEEKQLLNDKKISVILKSLNTGIERITQIVKGLNEFSRDTERMDEKFELHKVIDNCVLMLKNTTKNRITVKTEYFDKDFVFIGNSGKLHQAFLNILTNSVHAIKGEGEILVETRIFDNQISIEITDTGDGIPDELLNKVADPFFTTKSPGVGTGLGLAISSKIIKDHGGKLVIQSEEGKGTKVELLFPLNRKQP